MPLQKPLFFNNFQKGSTENANIGTGAFVGVETYTNKGIAKLTRDTTKRSGSVVTGKVIAFAKTSNNVFAQDTAGKVYRSINDGDTWTDISGSFASAGNGLIVYQGFLLAWDTGQVYYNSAFTAGGWTLWSGVVVTLTDFVSPFIFPNDGALYFASSTDGKMAKIFFGTAAAFNPAGSSGTDYFFSANWGGFQPDGSTPNILIHGGILPSQYQVTAISFLPNNYLALGTTSFSDTQACDLFLWNPTLATYETPLRLYSTGSQGQTGIRQLINRNNVLYAVTGGNMCLFSTNGTQFQQVEDFSLRTSYRLAGGAQASFPVFLNPQPSAITVLGNKLLIGTTKGTPMTGTGTPFGLFPMGIWTTSFTDGSTSGSASDSSIATQLEFPISTGTVRSDGANAFSIGALYGITDNQALIGWQDNVAFGIDKVDLDTFQTDITTVIIESSMMEIGTPLSPETIQNIEIYLVNDLLVGQTLSVYARKKFSDDFTLLQTFDPTVDGVSSEYKITKNAIGQTQYVQLRIQMSTGGSVTKFTPLLRNVSII